MALFPEVQFELLLPDGEIVAGRTAHGILVVTAREAIPRAGDLELELVSTVVFRRSELAALAASPLFRTRRAVSLPQGIIAGVHRFPFALDTPADLPPSFLDPAVEIRHAVHVRMGVAWARDPGFKVSPKVLLAPRRGARTPTLVRPRLELRGAQIELGVASTVVVEGEPVLGFVRLHGGTLDPFQGLELSLVHELTSAVAGNWMRTHRTGASVVITDEQLASGAPVPFELPGEESPSFRSDVLAHAVKLGIHPYGAFVSFRAATTLLPLDVLPRGSLITSADQPGNDPGRRSARVAAATGLREGSGAVVVEGEPSGVRLRIRTVGKEIHAELTCPPLPPGSDVVALLVSELDDMVLRFSERTLVLCSQRANEDIDVLVALAQQSMAHAAKLAAAIRSLPFPSGLGEESAKAWRACADATGAFLVPSFPALDGLVFRRLLAREERTFTASLTTAWELEVPRGRVSLELGSARLPERAMILLTNGVFPEALAALRETFTAIHASTSGGVLVLECASWSPDPRKVLPAIDAIVDWVLRERGEQRQGSPYR